MADPRLQWRQVNVAQPNVAGLMRNAQTSLNDAAASANDILGRYDDGQKERGDQELARLLASTGNREDLSALVNSDAVKGLRLSDKGVKMLNQAQGNRVDWANVDDTIRSRGVRDGLAQQAGARAQGEYDYQVNRRNELNGLSDEVVNARLEGQQYGTDGRPLNNDPLNNYLASTIQSESGGDPNARNSRSSATGLGQFIDSTWREMMAKHPDLGLTADGRTDPAQAERALRRFTEDNMNFLQSSGIPITEGNLYAAHFLGRGGARAVLSADDNASVAAIVGSDVVEANPFLRDMSVGQFRQWSAEKGGGNAPVGSRTPARDTLQTAVANSEFLSLDDVNSILNGNDDKIADGDAAIAKQLKQEQQDLLAGFLTQATANPDNLTTADVGAEVRDAVLGSGRFSEAEGLDAVKAAEALIAGSETLQTELAPSVAEDLERNNAVENTIADQTRRFEGTDQNRALGDIQRYTEDPTANLVSDLGLGSDGENPGGLGGLLGMESGFDANKLRNLVNEYANKFNVEPAVVAVAMRDSFNRDPFGRNDLRSRFDEETVQAAVEQLGPDQRQQFDRGQSNLEIMQGEMQQVRAQQNRIRQQIAKTEEGSAQRAALEAQLIALDGQLASIQQNRSR